MAAEILISSSPPRGFKNHSLSSSPLLPSMEEILQKRPQVMRSGSRAVPIPTNASASFTTATALLELTPSLNIIGSFDTAEAAPDVLKAVKAVKPRKPAVKKAASESKPAKPRKAASGGDNGNTVVTEKKKVVKPRAKKLIADPSEEKAAKVVKPRAKKADKVVDPDGTKEKPARKPRAKKADGEAQPKLAKGKVTKVSTAKTKATKPVVLETQPESPLLDLPKALKKRETWTPPKPENEPEHAISDILFDQLAGFAGLFGTYGFTKSGNSSATIPLATDITARKRKLIELVKTDAAISAAVSPEKKVKALKKKAKTITEQATSAYKDDNEIPDFPAAPVPLLQYFSLETSERLTIDGFKVPLKPRSKSPVKGKGKGKKGTAQAPILLSPESAMKQVGVQDFVFGTSSQLAREDSPTLLRDLHAAMQASNHDDDPFVDVFNSSPPAPRRRTELTTKRNLWSAASRDDSGDLIDIPMVDLVDSPAVAQQNTAPASASSTSPTKLEVWHDIDPTPVKIGLSKPASAPVHVDKPTASMTEPLSTLKSPKITKVKKSYISTKVKSPAKAKKASVNDIPNYNGYTDAQLAKEIASYHFKPVKRRAQMIALLEQCAESKRQLALRNLSTNTLIFPVKPSQDEPPPSAQPVKESPKRPRGRPRKDTIVQYLDLDSDTPLSQVRTPKKSRKAPVEDLEPISDSDTPLRLSSRQPTSQMTPLRLKSSTADSEVIPELDPDEDQKVLFKHISRAIKAAPRSKEPLNPSWYEKILLYDPIVLEDLTIWLNTGGLDTVGWDEEVRPLEVKKWCDSKSICCLWRQNLRGGTRSRY